jgi:hypothetical protein
MRYSDVYTFVKAALTDLGYGTDGHPAMPMFDPGPPTQARLLKKSPNAICFLTLGNGIGLAKEGLFDQPFITVRVVGRQNDFAGAETLAYDVDSTLLAVDGNTTVGTAKTLYITRTGGAPQLIDFDDAERYQFQTTYITEAQR